MVHERRTQATRGLRVAQAGDDLHAVVSGERVQALLSEADIPVSVAKAEQRSGAYHVATRQSKLPLSLIHSSPSYCSMTNSVPVGTSTIWSLAWGPEASTSPIISMMAMSVGQVRSMSPSNDPSGSSPMAWQ